ncbi:MAG TPA: dTDP-glucose 4,6-dehydratase [Chloroflexota bacterium]|nr:dTDP-glucose 4,6-dehydratase [Chloroflexota bacterium]
MGRRLLVTGGAGFIGSAFVRNHLRDYPDDTIVVLDKLTYAGNLANLAPVAENPRYRFVRGDIADAALVRELVRPGDVIVNFAAETHVDRSILDPGSFIETDVKGTYVLLEAARQAGAALFCQISTDEVYGDVPEGAARETDPLAPRSPYAASKASAELLVRAYHITYGLPTVITRASNNFGPYQFPEKFLPVVIASALDDRPIPLYGDGRQRRDWLYVDDHCAALELVLERGEPGTAYNIGGGNERENRALAEQVLDLLGKPRSLIQSVPDRPGHDRRYAVDSSRIHALGWRPAHAFDAALAATVRWYVEHQAWWRPLLQRQQAYFRQNYENRERLLRR